MSVAHMSPGRICSLSGLTDPLQTAASQDAAVFACGESQKRYASEMSESAAWNKQHEKYTHAGWIGKPTLFGEWALQYFPSKGKVLDAGCGQAQDTKLFASKGYDVVAADFADVALNFAREKMPDELKERVEFQQINLSEPLPFEDCSFDVVYSHMASHYFDEATTQRLFDEYLRILKSSGVLILLTNSVYDPEISQGRKLEEGFYRIGDMHKRFFSADSIKQFAHKFQIVMADENGETYKDRITGNSKLVRLVARKVS